MFEFPTNKINRRLEDAILEVSALLMHDFKLNSETKSSSVYDRLVSMLLIIPAWVLASCNRCKHLVNRGRFQSVAFESKKSRAKIDSFTFQSDFMISEDRHACVVLVLLVTRFASWRATLTNLEYSQSRIAWKSRFHRKLQLSSRGGGKERYTYLI